MSFLILYNILLQSIMVPFIICDLYYAYENVETGTGSSLLIQEWLTVCAYSNLIVVALTFWVSYFMIKYHSFLDYEKNDLCDTRVCCLWFAPTMVQHNYYLFYTVWTIFGVCLFLYEEIGDSSLYNYVFTYLVLKSATIGIVLVESAYAPTNTNKTK